MLSEAKARLAGKKILVSTQDNKCWVAVLKDNRLVDLFVEDERRKSIVGNIYKISEAKGTAEFVDIGIGRSVFLPYKENIEERLSGEVSLVSKIIKKMGEIFFSRPGGIVQVTRDAEANKSPRVSRLITLSNREFVYLPLAATIVGISHRITDSEERVKLSRVVEKFRGENKIKGGFIVRTLARGIPPERLINSARNLVELWKQIEWKDRRAAGPGLVYEAADYISRAVRDEFEKDDILIINNSVRYRQLKNLSEGLFDKSGQVYFYQEKTPLWKLHAVEGQIRQLLQRRVKLPGGGSLVIDETEAATTIDVNSGRLMGKQNPEEVALQTNREACWEIARQVRLRGIGGIIVIDFINMNLRTHCREIETILRKAFEDDRERLEFTPISKLGIVELSRHRTRPSLRKLLGKPCPHCKGRGLLFNTK